jgi:hypothetical protein
VSLLRCLRSLMPNAGFVVRVLVRAARHAR